MRRIAVFLFCVILLAAVTGGEATVWAQQRPVVGFSVSTQVNPFYVAMANGVREEAARQGMQAVVLNAEDRLDKQISDVEDLIQRGVNVLLINATHDGAGAVVEKAAAAGIKVITLQRGVPSPAVTAHIGTDNVVIGRMGAQWVVDRLGGRGNVVVLEGVPGAASSEDRKVGSAEVFARNPGIRIVAQQTGHYDRARAMSVMENILQAQRNIDAVYCFNDEMAMGALAAIRASRRSGIIITGMDANRDAVEAVRRGDLTMTIALPPHDIGRMGVLYAKWLTTGEMSVPVQSVMPVQFITR